MAVESHLANHDVYKEKSIKLQTVRGTMTAEFDGEVYALFSFPRDGVKGTTQIQCDTKSLKRLDIPVEAMELVIKNALEAHASSSSAGS